MSGCPAGTGWPHLLEPSPPHLGALTSSHRHHPSPITHGAAPPNHASHLSSSHGVCLLPGLCHGLSLTYAQLSPPQPGVCSHQSCLLSLCPPLPAPWTCPRAIREEHARLWVLAGAGWSEEPPDSGSTGPRGCTCGWGGLLSRLTELPHG